MSSRSRPAKARSTTRPAPAPARTAAPAEPWWTRIRPWQAALALALVHLALGLASLDPTMHIGGDNASYLALARSILERGTYQELWDPAQRPHTQYPPGWPLILAGAMLAGVKPWIGFKVLSIIASAGAVALSYLWARRVSSAGVALAVAAALALSPGVIDLARWELSDVPFWCFTMLGLWGFARVADTPDPAPDAPPSARWRAGLGAVALGSLGVLVAYATRSAGVPLVVAAAGWLAWRRRWAGLALFAAVIGPFALAWWARGRALGHTGYAGYLWYVDPYTPALGKVSFVGMLERIVRNLWEYTSDHLPYLLIGSRMTTIAIIAGAIVVVLSIAGWILRLRRAGLAEIWLPLYIGLVLIWPAEWSGERFLLPVYPMMLLCTAEVVRRMGTRVGQPVLLGAGMAAVLVIGGAPKVVAEVRLSSECRAVYSPQTPYPCLPQEWLDYLDLARGSQGQLRDGAVVLARKPTLFWALTGYPSRVYPFTNNPDTLIAVAREAKAEYLVVDYLDNVAAMYLAPVLMQRPRAFCVLRAAGPGRATLMGIHPQAEQIPNARAAPVGSEQVTIGFSWCPGAAPPPEAMQPQQHPAPVPVAPQP